MSYPPTPQRKACDCSDPCISTDDVYYAGPNLPNSGINTYNVLTEVIEKLDAIYAVPTLQRVTEMDNLTTLPIIADSFVKIGGNGTNLLLDDGTVLPIGDLPAGVTETSQLINDGEDGIHPFITAQDIPAFVPSDYDLDEFTNTGIDPFAHVSDIPAAPGLQQVLDVSHVAIKEVALDVTNSTNIVKIQATPYQINFTKISDNSQFQVDGFNKRIVSSNNDALSILYFPLVNGQYPSFNMPSKPSGTYTLATLDDIPTLPTLTSGTYTPTVASIVNTSGGSTNRLSTYTRIGNIVSVKADVLITFTAALTESIFSITLPVPFSTAEGTQYVGSAISSATPYDSGFVQIVTTTASVYMKPTNSGTARIVITFTYRAA